MQRKTREYTPEERPPKHRRPEAAEPEEPQTEEPKHVFSDLPIELIMRILEYSDPRDIHSGVDLIRLRLGIMNGREDQKIYFPNGHLHTLISLKKTKIQDVTIPSTLVDKLIDIREGTVKAHLQDLLPEKLSSVSIIFKRQDQNMFGNMKLAHLLANLPTNLTKLSIEDFDLHYYDDKNEEDAFLLLRRFTELKSLQFSGRVQKRTLCLGRNLETLRLDLKNHQDFKVEGTLPKLRTLVMKEAFLDGFTNYFGKILDLVNVEPTCNLRTLRLQFFDVNSKNLFPKIPRTVTNLSLIGPDGYCARSMGRKVLSGISRHMKDHQLKSLEISTSSYDVKEVVNTLPKVAPNLQELILHEVSLNRDIAEALRDMQNLQHLGIKKGIIFKKGLRLLLGYKGLHLTFTNCTYNHKDRGLKSFLLNEWVRKIVTVIKQKEEERY